MKLMKTKTTQNKTKHEETQILTNKKKWQTT